MNHRRLPKRRQRLVGRVRRVHPDSRPAGVGQQPVIGPLRSRDPLHRRGPIPVFLSVFRRRQRLLERSADDHGGALPGPRHGGGERIPRLVPQEADVRLDRQHFLHDAPRVVDDAVEDAVGQQQHAYPVQLPGRLQVQQRLLDGLQRHRRHRSRTAATGRLEVQRVRAGQHQAVVVRLVAVAVDQHDVAGPGQGLHDDFVRGRRSVGDEVGVVGVPGRAALSIAFLMLPCGSSSESRPPEVVEVSAIKMLRP